MSKLTLTTFLTLDGVMQAPGMPEEDRSGGFQHGGWVFPYFDDDMGRYVTEWFRAAEAFLLGRKTYQIFAAYFPRITDPEDPIASVLNRLPKHVVSTTLDKVEWRNSTLIRGDVVKEVARLKRQGEGELQVHGSGGLAQTLIENELIDEYRLLFYPVVLGTGKRLFGSGAVPASLELIETKRTSAGVVANTYRPLGKPKYGSFALEG
jgi:dihydrofolate reductase